VHQYWTTRRDELEAQLAERKAGTSGEGRGMMEEEKEAGDFHSPQPSAPHIPTNDIISHVTHLLIRNYDKRNGGLGSGQKFPMSDAWELLLAVYAQTSEEKLLEMLSQTLIAMGTKGMYDNVAGGFFRYSTTPDWTVPHFEKMLEDHGRLLTVYLHAIQTARSKAYTQPLAQQLEHIVRTALDYLTTTLLYDKLGLTYFAGSQDADEEYYLLSKSEREQQTAPFIDWRLYADWNALMVSTLFLAADVLREPHYATLAEKVLNTVVRLCVNANGSVTHSVTIDESARLQNMLKPATLCGQLSDCALLAKACIEQHLRGETEARLYGRSRLQLARWMIDFALRELAATDGSFYDSPANPNAHGMLKVRIKPIFDNALMSEVLLLFHHVNPAPDASLLVVAQRALAAFVEEYARYGEHGSPYALATLKATHEPTKIMIVAQRNAATAFAQAAHNTYSPWRIVHVLDPKQDAELIRQHGYPTERLPVALVCKGTTCSAPIFEASELQ
jgi:hypothetical protein